LYTNPRAEKKVHAELTAKGVPDYLPTQKTLKKWSDRKKWVEEPLFKSYIFVRINYEKSSRDILNVKGVIKFVRFGSELATLRDSQIDDIKLVLSNFEGIEIEHISISPGQEVSIKAGPLRGMTGKVAERKGNKYFSIEIEQIGAQLLVSLPAHYLENR
jgi:transcription antitermination factor NusG